MAERAWPPVGWLWEQYERWGAWYSGDPQKLAAVDGFHGGGERQKLHVPMARALSQMSAGLLFCGSPTARCPDAALDERLQALLKQTGFYSKLLQAAELQSAYGGVFLKLNWNRELSEYPLLSVLPADAGLADYAHGELRSVTFWSALRTEEQTGVCYRLEEEYTPDGRILSRLFQGTETELGGEISLGSIPEGEGIEAEAVSGAGCLLAAYVPNRLPNPDAPAEGFGRSDLHGLTGLLSALDEAYSALMRDVRLGKARVIVPMEFLRRKELLLSSAGEGASASFVFDLNEEIFTALDINPQDSGAGITVVQAQIRAKEHLQAIDDLVRRILLMGGFSPQSVGMSGYGQAESGTALNVRERLSLQTTEVKKTYWWHALTRLLPAMLRLDAALNGGSRQEQTEVSVEFADNTQPDLMALADVAHKLAAAGAISTERKVRLISPDLSEEAVKTETKRIEEGV